MGDAIFQKHYTTETLPYRRIRNNGEKPMYYTENYNPPIIDENTFNAAQNLIKQKAEREKGQKTSSSSMKLYCPECGRLFGRQTLKGHNYWNCSKLTSNRSKCKSRRVREDMVCYAFLTMTYKLKAHRCEVLDELIQQMENLRTITGENSERIRQIDKQIADLCAKRLVVARLHTNGVLGMAEYTTQDSEIDDKINRLRTERRKKLLQYTRMLKKIGVDVFFEEHGIHSIRSGAEFYITIYGSIAQSESENISANVKFGKAQSAREGNVAFHYKNFLGYRKGKDGKPEIVPEEADTVRFIYKSFLAGDSLGGILDKLEKERKPSPSGKEKWSYSTIQSILTNEKYVGDAIINKTYTEDCLSKRIKKNNGERRKYYIENNHPAIIEREVFAKVQEEIARRSSKQKTKQVGTKTEQGKYSSKYAFTELLICGECKTPYRRCTWTSQGRKRIVWRCINRLDYGKKYCHDSPTIEEGVLKESVMNAIFDAAEKNVDLLKELRRHIGMGLNSDASDDDELKIVIRMSEIDTEFSQMLNAVTEDTTDSFDEERAKILMGEKANLQRQLDRIAEGKRKQTETEARLNDIYSIMESLKNHPIRYDDSFIRQIVECIIVESKERITSKRILKCS